MNGGASLLGVSGGGSQSTDAVQLSYWIGDRSYAWRVTKDRVRLVPLSINAAQVDALVKSYQQSIVTSLPVARGGAASQPCYSGALSNLHWLSGQSLSYV